MICFGELFTKMICSGKMFTYILCSGVLSNDLLWWNVNVLLRLLPHGVEYGDEVEYKEAGGGEAEACEGPAGGGPELGVGVGGQGDEADR